MKQITQAIDTILITTSSLVAIDTIESLLGIILLTFNILWIITKLIVRIYTMIKNKKYDELDDVMREGIEGINNIKDSLYKEN